MSMKWLWSEALKLILCHLAGDYVLQTDFIANSKGENLYHMFVHCTLYISPFYIAYGFSLKLIILFITHIIIDTMKARYNVISYSTDQILHYIIAFILYFQII